MNLILNFLLYGVAVMAAGYVLPNVSIKNFQTAFVVAALLIVANFTLVPVLNFFAFPVNVLTLGLFSWVINAFVIKLIDAFLDDFEVNGFFAALLYAVVLAVFKGVLNMIFM